MADNRNVFDGIKFLLHGQKITWGKSTLLVAAGRPLLFSGIAYLILLLLFIVFRRSIHANIEEYINDLPSFVQFIKKPLLTMIQIIMHLFAGAVVLIVCGPVFWFTGKDFIHQCVIKLEGEHIPLAHPEPHQMLIKTVGLIVCGILLLLALILLSLLLAIIPFFGQFIAILLMAYGMSLLYISMLRSYRPITPQESQNIFGEKFIIPAGFGFAAYVLCLVPFIGILFMPGIFTGLILMLNSRRS